MTSCVFSTSVASDSPVQSTPLWFSEKMLYGTGWVSSVSSKSFLSSPR